MIKALTDWTYYDGTYKAAMGNITVPQADFPRLAIKASNLIRKYTFGNIDESKTILDSVQFCCCELVENMYAIKLRDDGTEGMTSEKDGSWSVTYESQEKKEEADLKVQKGIIYQYLANTGFMYCGVN